MTQENILIGSRRSKLAIYQSNQVKALIEAHFPQYNCVVITHQTLGDQKQMKPLYSFGGKSLWTKELEDLLYTPDKSSRLDLIVHSLKDMPTQIPTGFELAGITNRVDPSDCLIMAKGSPYRTLADLPDGAVVGTSSVRRSAQLKKLYPKLQYISVRGNIHTRLRKLDDPDTPFQCIILATAGLIRMNLHHRITQRFDSNTMYHAVGQGALGIEIRKGDTKIQNIIQSISDWQTAVCCTAERSLMSGLEAGCSVPLGVNTNYDLTTKLLTLEGCVIDIDGTGQIICRVETYIETLHDARACGQLLCDKMIANGARELLDCIDEQLNEANATSSESTTSSIKDEHLNQHLDTDPLNEKIAIPTTSKVSS
ncbi:hypothetical protein TBLA_0A01470 [Henningerozyma blattae CBS 6284]|uniref:hydroxymethylbilane synthase n=1 Tax=Henningerozyma blattae (strain ATCC 34711 / CBS 6284 / DSM 70876 / NBRC 10599 / NRRL Y-10934 / UCD 77-7) TaxID=1071380 RepID=I2GUZ4_HENB6|nr:hypothetical protein TBLA_0A01470 [Tetrapisispora blattae CBS 6284]CCH57946.1 hypothetical protein TBLA_0A01470 [Tetrapisispora blattae CBS 6284]